MNLFAVLARAVKRPRRDQIPAMTPAQKATLKKLDDAIRAEPHKATPYFNRARYLDFCGADFARVLEAIREGVRLSCCNRKSYINAYYLLEINREDWGDYVRGQKMAEANYWLAYAVASFEVALQRSLDLENWNATRPPDWDAVAALKSAAKLDYQNSEDLPETPDELKILAHALAIVGEQCTRFNKDDERCADFVAAQLYTRALRLQHRGYKWSAENFYRAARNGANPDYKQWAWWNFIIELAPDEARWRRERARWLSSRDFDKLALPDMARAIELSPDDPTLYEMRAKISSDGDWWNVSPTSNSKTADYLRALELRIAAAQIDGTPAKLRAQADQLLPAIRRNRGHSHARARAFITLAIAATPDDAGLYLARANAGDAYGDPIEGEDGIYAVNYLDYARALALDETLEAARAGIVIYLRSKARRPTAHEQIEALLNARQELREIGVKSELANAIIGEVERALAA